MERAGALAQVARAPCYGWKLFEGAQHQQHPHQGLPLSDRIKKGDAARAISRSRGGRTSKIHALANTQRKPVAFVLTPSNLAEVSIAKTRLDGITPPKRLLANKAYDANHLREQLQTLDTEVVIPFNRTRRRPCPLGRIAYYRGNAIERMFCRMKNWRSITTRYDRLTRNFLLPSHLSQPFVFFRHFT